MSDEITPEAEEFVDEFVKHPVALFALEWCEFCWSVKKLFKHMGIPFEFVDLDSAKYQEDNFGKRIRAVLAKRTGAVTIPQIFIDGEYVGGSMDVFELQKEGELTKKLDAANISYNKKEAAFDAYSLLPQWLQPR